MRTYVETPPPVEGQEKAPAPGTRRAVRKTLDRTFEDYRLFLGPNPLQRNERVQYGKGRSGFTFDFAYAPAGNGRRDFVHAIGAANDFEDAVKAGSAFVRARGFLEHPVGLTAVLDPGVREDAQGELERVEVHVVGVGEAHKLARRIQVEIGR